MSGGATLTGSNQTRCDDMQSSSLGRVQDTGGPLAPAGRTWCLTGQPTLGYGSARLCGAPPCCAVPYRMPNVGSVPDCTTTSLCSRFLLAFCFLRSPGTMRTMSRRSTATYPRGLAAPQPPAPPPAAAWRQATGGRPQPPPLLLLRPHGPRWPTMTTLPTGPTCSVSIASDT